MFRFLRRKVVVIPPGGGGGKGQISIRNHDEHRFLTVSRQSRLSLALRFGFRDPHGAIEREYRLRVRAADGALKEDHVITNVDWWIQVIHFKSGDHLSLQMIQDDRLSRTIDWWLGQGTNPQP